MTAKEMFDELGYGLSVRSAFTDCIIYGDILKGEIIFDTTYKNVICNVSITPELHQVIHQQMIELGWINGSFSIQENSIEKAIFKLVWLYENLDSYSNSKIRERLDEIIKLLRSENGG